MKFDDYLKLLNNAGRRDFFRRAGTTRQMFWKWRSGARFPRAKAIESLSLATNGECSFFEVQKYFRDLSDARYIASKRKPKERSALILEAMSA